MDRTSTPVVAVLVPAVVAPAVVGLAVAALLACNTGPTRSATPRSEPRPTPTPSAVVPPEPVRWAELLPTDAPDRAHAELPELDRVPGLTDDHRRRLREHGLFVTPQPEPSHSLGGASAGQARAGRRAKHLFQVYERNDYVRFPSYVTVDLAIDLTHQYFDSVLRGVEQEHLAPMLAEALRGYVKRAVAMRDGAKTDEARKAAAAAAGYWATALRLLEQPAKGDAPERPEARPPWWGDPETMAIMEEEAGPPPPPPPAPPLTRFDSALERDVVATVATVHAAKGTKRFEVWGQRLDLTLTTPRSHYNGSGVLQRYFRAMSWLGSSTFPVTGERARPAVLLALALCTDATGGNDLEPTAAFEGVLAVTNAVVGQPPTVGLTDALRIARTVAPKGELDGLLEPATLAAIVDEWKRLPAHPIETDLGPVVQPIGGRVFADAGAMAALLPTLRELPPDREPLVRHAMGAAGAAAMLGSELAREAVLTSAGQQRARIEAAIADGRERLAVATTRDDAYHRTLAALSQVLSAEPYYFDPRAHQVRMLGTFAGGWAQLRHDTLLYAYQMGAECDAEELTSPYGFVEPYPELYAGLRAMVQGFEARLREVGIHEPSDSITAKTEAVASLLRRLEDWSRKELRGEPFTEDERTDIAMVGGFAEHALLTLADAYELGEGNDDMAVIADVLTLRGQALEVGVAHPELVYAVIPTPEGWRLARGAVLAYREFFVPADQRLTDEAWRARVAASPDLEASARPPWLAEIMTAPVGVVGLPADGQSQTRCEYYGGAFAL